MTYFSLLEVFPILITTPAYFPILITTPAYFPILITTPAYFPINDKHGTHVAVPNTMSLYTTKMKKLILLMCEMSDSVSAMLVFSVCG